MKVNIPLAPCPICGATEDEGALVILSYDDETRVFCMDCMYQESKKVTKMPVCDSDIAAVDSWNEWCDEECLRKESELGIAKEKQCEAAS